MHTSRLDRATAQLIEDAILAARFFGRYEGARILLGYGVPFRDIARLLAGDANRRAQQLHPAWDLSETPRPIPLHDEAFSD